MTDVVIPDSALQRLRAEFPALSTVVRGKPLVYLDNAATTQVPQVVMDAVARFLRSGRGNVRRGVHALSEHATAAYESARGRVRAFINARDTREIVFLRGTTEAINLVAYSFGQARIFPGDRVVVSEMEHHSNLVPWQMLCRQRGAALVKLPVTDAGQLDLDKLDELLSPPTKLLAVTHVSNALGHTNPIRALAEACRARGVVSVVDGAQAVAHLPVDVQQLGCDFYAFSGHKLYAPAGIGVLYGRRELLESLPPFLTGGDMVSSVSFEVTSFDELPHRFEGGTPNVEGALGLSAAIEYLGTQDRALLLAHERSLAREAARCLKEFPGLSVLGHPEQEGAIVSFVAQGVHPHDIGTLLDEAGVAVRAGHHCAQPLLAHFGVGSTVRASFAFYNTLGEVEVLLEGVSRALEMLRP